MHTLGTCLFSSLRCQQKVAVCVCGSHRCRREAERCCKHACYGESLGHDTGRFGRWTEKYSLTVLNSSMRRIDLICKLIAPLVISGIIKGSSMRIGILIVGTLSLTCFGIEIFTSNYVWRTNRRLRDRKSKRLCC